MKTWDEVSKEMRSHGTPLSALGYCKIAFDAGLSTANTEMDTLRAELFDSQQRTQYFHALCFDLGIPNGVMQYRVDWVRSYIADLKSRIKGGK